MAMKSLLARLIERGDTVCVENGKLCISSLSGNDVPADWYKRHYDELVSALAVIFTQPVLIYEDHSVGRYGPGKWPGMLINFHCVKFDESLYSIFNVDLSRARTTSYGKAGDALPRGQFRVGNRSSLVKLWRRLDLDMPPRLSSFHDYMGNLKSRLLTFEQKEGNKVKSTDLLALNVSAREILEALVNATDKPLTSNSQNSDKCQTRTPYKKMSESRISNGVSENQTTCSANHIKSNQDKEDKRANTNASLISLMDQSVDEWLADYDSPMH